MTTAEPPAVAIEGMSHCYRRRQALNDVTFSIAPSTFAVLLGNYETNLLAKSASDPSVKLTGGKQIFKFSSQRVSSNTTARTIKRPVPLFDEHRL
jgi:hypothetical protein